MTRDININMTGHIILVPGLELNSELSECEHGPLDAPDFIPAGYSIGSDHYASIVCQPIPRSVSRYRPC